MQHGANAPPGTALRVGRRQSERVPAARMPASACGPCRFWRAQGGDGCCLVGIVGLAAGIIGACDVTMTCLACGDTWRPGSN
jgi:hypothetical protein